MPLDLGRAKTSPAEVANGVPGTPLASVIMRLLCWGQVDYHPAGSAQETPLSIRYARSDVVEFFVETTV